MSLVAEVTNMMVKQEVGGWFNTLLTNPFRVYLTVNHLLGLIVTVLIDDGSSTEMETVLQKFRTTYMPEFAAKK